MIPVPNSDQYFTLITGASEGIGKALAEYCAQLGFNLVLIALPGDTLKSAEEYLKSKYKIEVYSLGIDLTSYDAGHRVINWLDKNNISVNMLINNAGCSSIGYFDEISCDNYLKQIQLNIISLTCLTRQLIKRLKSNQPAYILNVGSIAGFFMVPYKAVYGATKSFVISFSLSLREELASSGIKVSVVCPGGVTSNHHAIRRKTKHGWIGRMSYLNPEQVAEAAIKGLFRNKRIIIPGFINRLLFFLNQILTPQIRAMIAINGLGKELENEKQVVNLKDQG